MGEARDSGLKFEVRHLFSLLAMLRNESEEQNEIKAFQFMDLESWKILEMDGIKRNS